MSMGWQHWALWMGGLATGLTGLSGTAIAAETVVLTYGFLSVDIPIEDLQTLSDTGETSDELDRLLDVTSQDPEVLRTTLNEPVELNSSFLDMALSSPPGDWLLDQLGEMIQPASGEAGGRTALRAALIGAASDDNQVTLMELMRVYPSSEIVVKGDRVVEGYGQLYEALEPLIDLAEILQTAHESTNDDE
ncbi:MAG: alpha/beta hydrolase [Cyanobacteria bacterium P01_H01_bin.58]